jgi:cysteine synthase A
MTISASKLASTVEHDPGAHNPVYSNVLGMIGHTPLVALDRVLPSLTGRLYAKIEGANPGGSAKDRAAFNMLRHGLETGEINQGTTVIESSSGNMGIGLAMACAYFRLHMICVVDPKASLQNIRIMRTYGADIQFISEPDPETGEFLTARIAHVKALLAQIPNSVWTNQYANRHNALAHYATMHEIDLALGGRIDYLFCATSTCGTIRGCSSYIREQGMKTRVIAVDALGSQIFGSRPSRRYIPGLGAAMVPDLARGLSIDRVLHVTDLDCVHGCRRLMELEAVFAGGSSGGVIAAIERSLPWISVDDVCVAILPDRGERYLDTIFSDEWVEKHLGEAAI